MLPDDNNPLQWLADIDKAHSWDDTCHLAEVHYEPLARHLGTWGPHCGAPYAVYRGHLVRMLLDIANNHD